MIQWFLDRCKSSIVPLIEVEERMMMARLCQIVIGFATHGLPGRKSEIGRAHV